MVSIAWPKTRPMCLFRCLFWLFAGCLWLRNVPAEPLTFAATLQLAEQQSPDLQAQAASVAAARSAALAAGALPDPKLLLGIDNLPANGMDQWSLSRDFMTMQRLGVMQEVPNRAKRQAQLAFARADTSLAESQQRLQRLSVRRDAALAWLNRYYLEQQSILFEQLQRENQLFAGTVQAQLGAGRGAPADAIAAALEAAELADRRDALQADIDTATATLMRFVGNAGTQPLAGAPPPLAFDAEHLRSRIHEHADLAVFTPMREAATAQWQEARAAKRPDWAVELVYARRGAQFSDMVSAQFTVGLPLFSGSRQDPQIAAAHQAVLRVDAEREVMLRDHAAELEAELAQAQKLKQQLQRLNATRLPLAQQKVDLQLASYQAGTGDLNAVLAARRERVEVQLTAVTLAAQQAAIAAKLYFAYGEGAQ